MMEVWAAKYRESHDDVKIFLFPASSARGNMAVIEGQADIGMFSVKPDLLVKPEILNYYPVACDAVVITINSNNPWKEILKKKGAAKEDLESIYTAITSLQWAVLTEELTPAQIVRYTRSDLCGAGEMFADFLNIRQQDLNGIGVYGDPGMLTAVRCESYGLGYNNLRYVYNTETGCCFEGITVVPLDLNGNGCIDTNEYFYDSLAQFTRAITNEFFLYPLARKLYLVFPAKSANPDAMDFIRWILNEGQQYVEETGYIKVVQSDN
jgi:phosphate transport system substrate-binding protein